MTSTGITLHDLTDKCELQSQDLEKEISEEHLRDVSRIIDDHEIVGFELELTQQEMNDINQDGQTQVRRRLKMLKKWKQKNAFKATYRKLIDALLKCHRGDAARDVCELLSQSKWGYKCADNTHNCHL